jgi:hypothetical protein
MGMIQVGTRWAFGATPPSRLSPELIRTIGDVEALALAERGEDGSDPRESMWTLTWLEGKPFAALEFTTGAGVEYTVTVHPTTGAPEILASNSESESESEYDDWDS